MSLVNLKVGVRLGLGFGLLLVLMIVMAVLGLSRITEIKDNLDDIVEHDVVAMSNVMEMREAVNAIAIATRNIVLLTDAESIAAEARRIDAAWKYYAATAKTLSSRAKNNRGKPGAPHAPCGVARWLVASLAGAALVLGTLTAWFIARSIIRPLHLAVELASAVDQGALTHRTD